MGNICLSIDNNRYLYVPFRVLIKQIYRKTTSIKMTFRQVQNQRYETALEVRVSILADEIGRLRGFVKDLMLVVEHLREKVENVPGENEKEKKEKEEKEEKAEKDKEDKEKKEREEKEKKKKTKFYSILSMAGIFSVIGAGILWRKM